MVEQVNSYKTSDGQVFWSEDEAVAHEVELDAAEKIEQYIQAAGHPDRQRTRVRSIINDYLGWVETGTSAKATKEANTA